MNWKLKSLVQRVCAALPVGQEGAYFLIQRTLGRLRHPPEPWENLRAAAEIATELPWSLEGMRVMEVGTGRRVDMPLAFYLLGAAHVHTFDLYRYLREEFVWAAVGAFVRQREKVHEALGALVPTEVLDRRLTALASAPSVRDVLRVSGIQYHAPADAAKTGLPDGSIDLHFSYTVFEHIPGEVLRSILREASRVVAPQGVACHHIDPSDHFAHADASINFVNFLRYGEAEFARYNNNQFAYHNRLRVTDYRQLYADVGHEVLKWITSRDERSLRDLAAGFPVAAPFGGLSHEDLATTVVRSISRPLSVARATAASSDRPVLNATGEC